MRSLTLRCFGITQLTDRCFPRFDCLAQYAIGERAQHIPLLFHDSLQLTHVTFTSRHKCNLAMNYGFFEMMWLICDLSRSNLAPRKAR